MKAFSSWLDKMVTLQILQYAEIASLSSLGKIRKLLNIAKQDRIVLLQGRLSKTEEIELIKTTMEEINSDFRGIEIAVINPETHSMKGLAKIREGMVNLLLGNKVGFTIIGPANIVKEIRKNPNKIELLTQEPRKRRSKKRRRR